MRLSGRTSLVVLHDVLATVAAWFGAYWLRFNLAIPDEYGVAALSTLRWVVPLEAAVFWYFGLYRGMWRFASLPDLKRILKAVAVVAAAVPIALILFRVPAVVPRTVLLLNPALLLLIIGGSRFLYRALKEHRMGALLAESRPVLIIGAGAAADILLRELARPTSKYRVTGLLDDDPAKRGRLVQGVAVLGLTAEIDVWSRQTGVRDVVLAIPSLGHAERKAMVERCTDLGLNLLTMPGLDDIMAGRVTVSSLRKIELDDLLGRDPVNLDNAGLMECLSGRVIMVTGAGGSIGAELCRQIAHFKPSRMVFVEQSEFALYQLEQEFVRLNPNQAIACLAGDVRDAARMRTIMAAHRPAMVYHAAAYKHVPLMEGANAMEALTNNVLGTAVVARAACAAGAEKFVMVSTDKAVNPTNVMGASKRLAEMVCQSLQREQGTRFVSVRFGNVLGSSGSVIPKFQQQIEAGGPITVTHPDITRYFMSIPEAAQLVLQAGLMGRGGEIFVLDMGEPVKIADLARLMIRLAGKDEGDIGIEFTGLRAGEKLYEELLADSELTLVTPHPKLRIAQARSTEPDWLDALLSWLQQDPIPDDVAVRRALRNWVPEYRPAMAPGLKSIRGGKTGTDTP
jgi:FlaA1/EpsC-like NDP-sugar epimerase